MVYPKAGFATGAITTLVMHEPLKRNIKILTKTTFDLE